MVRSIRASGTNRQMKEMEEEYRSGKMGQDMMVSGLMVKHMDEEDLFMLKVIYMMVNGLKIKHMDMEFNKIIKEVDMKVNGKMINKMVKVLKNGQMVQYMMDNTKMA